MLAGHESRALGGCIKKDFPQWTYPREYYYRIILLIEPHILTNSRKDSSLINPATGKYLELDFWIPKHKLGFEFQVIRSSKCSDLLVSGCTSLLHNVVFSDSVEHYQAKWLYPISDSICWFFYCWWMPSRIMPTKKAPLWLLFQSGGMEKRRGQC